MRKPPADHAQMVGRSRKAPKSRSRAPTTYFIGPWLRALGHKQRDLVTAGILNEGYLSELISGGKRNPSAEIIMDIADFLGIPVDYLREPPPTPEFIQQASELDPEVLKKLRKAR